MPLSSTSFSFFFFNDTATTEIYTLSLHDALPIYLLKLRCDRSNEYHWMSVPGEFLREVQSDATAGSGNQSSFCDHCRLRFYGARGRRLLRTRRAGTMLQNI